MVVLNLLSSVLTYFLHTHDLPLVAALVVGGFALGNAVFGVRIAIRLMRDDPAGVNGALTGAAQEAARPK
jgi:hypothetical protein